MPHGYDITPTIRPAVLSDAEGIARVHVASWRSTYRGIVPNSVLDALDETQRAGQWRRGIGDTTSGQLIYVAEHSEQGIVGFVAGGPERSGDYPDYTGEIYAIYLLDPWQGRGTGRQLLRTGVQGLLQQGHTSMLIWALTENPACGFYQRVGGEIVATQSITMGQATLEETAFGWKNSSMVLNESAEGTRDGDDQ